MRIVGVVVAYGMGGSVPRTPSPSVDPHRCPYAGRPGVCSEPAHRHRLAHSALRYSWKIVGCYFIEISSIESLANWKQTATIKITTTKLKCCL